MTDKINWEDYPNFSEKEFKCKHTGICDMDKDFMEILSEIRKEYGKPMIITSGYRHPTHPVESSKPIRGEHTYGVCCDVSVRGEDCYNLISVCIKKGITRLGVSQKGENRFIHIGIGYGDKFLNPWVWSY